MKLPLCILAVLLVPAFAYAEEGPKITVNGVGTEPVVPTALEISVGLKAKGDDAAMALNVLKAERDKVLEKLKPLGAEPGKDGLPTMVDKAQLEAMRQQVQQRSGGRFKKPAKKEDEKASVEMRQSITARVPLKGKDTAAVMIEAEELKAKVAALKLIEAPAEEGEGDEEQRQMEMMMNRYGNEQASDAGVSFAYFAPANEDLQTVAIKKALANTELAAKRAAKAMGKTAVEVHSINLGADNSDVEYNYDRYGRAVPAKADKGEGMRSPSPEMSVAVRVMVIYSVK